MRRAAFILTLFLLAVYIVLHLVLASSPVQRYVVGELKSALSLYGIDVSMESVEFSGLFPKIYLNRVRLKTKKSAPVQFPEPLAIDKIKLEFRPIALLYKTIVIEELTLIHPTVYLPNADLLYAKLQNLLKQSSPAALESGGSFGLQFKKFGVVDALVNVSVKDPKLKVRSPSLSVMLEMGAGSQKAIYLEGRTIELEYDQQSYAFSKVDFSADLAPKSVRINRGLVETADFSLNLKGISGLELDANGLPDSLQVSYEVRVALEYLSSKLKLERPLTGSFKSSGTLGKSRSGYVGEGEISYSDAFYGGYLIGNGNTQFQLAKDAVQLSKFRAEYSGGVFRSKELVMELAGRYPIKGSLDYTGYRFEKQLPAVGVNSTPVLMGMKGAIEVSGALKGPFEITAKLNSLYDNLHVLQDASTGVVQDNEVIFLPGGSLLGTLKFTLDEMRFNAQIGALGGSVDASGYLLFDTDKSEIKVRTQNTSLTQLANIANLRLAGVGDLSAEIAVDEKGTRVAGTFDLAQGKVAGAYIGSVKGEAYYQKELLSFENLEVPSLEPIRANGYVDFRTPKTHYKFYVDGPRAEMDQVFRVFEGRTLGFSQPKGGESSLRLSIEGGAETFDFEIVATGQAKNIDWYDEKWLSGTYSVAYRDGITSVRRVLLTKKSGGLELRGTFSPEQSNLRFVSHGLELEDFDYFEKAPLRGEVLGELSMEGSSSRLLQSATGEFRVVKTRFRNQPVEDSVIRISPQSRGTEFLVSVKGDALRARYLLGRPRALDSELLLYFEEYDFAPLLTLWLGKDIASLTELKASGELSLLGDFNQLRTLEGTGSVSELLVGFKEKPMRTSEPVVVRVDKGLLEVDRFTVSGRDNKVSLNLQYIPSEKIELSADGRVDLEYLQPFIPGLDYGSGAVNTRLRISGKPSKFQMLGNVTLEQGVFRLSGLSDEFRSVNASLSVSQDRINIDRFESVLGGGKVTIAGHAGIDQLTKIAPDLTIQADKTSLRVADFLQGNLSGNFQLKGEQRPYLFSGKCSLHEGKLTSFKSSGSSAVPPSSKPVMKYDVQCAGREKLYVSTEVMEAEFGGDFHLVGDSNNVGLLGSAEGIKGNLLFRETSFAMETASVRFESPTTIAPRFRVSGEAQVREVQAASDSEISELRDYIVRLTVSGTPKDFNIVLGSTPPLLENEIISLLVLGVTQQRQEGTGYLDFGTALVGQTPLQSKIQSEFGLDVKIRSQGQGGINGTSQLATSQSATDTSIPTVEIQKDITDSTKVSYSNALNFNDTSNLDSNIPISEFRIEQVLDDNFTVNATTRRSQGTGSTEPRQAYGIDVRYRFNFE